MFPRLHCVQVRSAVLLQSALTAVPGAQSRHVLHAVLPRMDAYFPLAQSVHMEAPASENFP